MARIKTGGAGSGMSLGGGMYSGGGYTFNQPQGVSIRRGSNSMQFTGTGRAMGNPNLSFSDARRKGLVTGSLSDYLAKQNAPAAPSTGGTGTGLPGSLSEAMRQANEKNEERYQQGLGIYDQMIGMTDSFGGTQKELIAQNLARQHGSDTQSLMGRGLGNTTVVDTMRRGRDTDASFQNRAVDEDVARMRMGVMGDKAGFIERRTDAGPDLGLYAQLYQNASSAPRYNAGLSTAGGAAQGIGVPQVNYPPVSQPLQQQPQQSSYQQQLAQGQNQRVINNLYNQLAQLQAQQQRGATGVAGRITSIQQQIASLGG